MILRSRKRIRRPQPDPDPESSDSSFIAPDSPPQAHDDDDDNEEDAYERTSDDPSETSSSSGVEGMMHAERAMKIASNAGAERVARTVAATKEAFRNMLRNVESAAADGHTHIIQELRRDLHRDALEDMLARLGSDRGYTYAAYVAKPPVDDASYVWIDWAPREKCSVPHDFRFSVSGTMACRKWFEAVWTFARGSQKPQIIYVGEDDKKLRAQ